MSSSVRFSDQIHVISKRLGIPYKTAHTILDSYAKYVSFRSASHPVVTVLGIAELYSTHMKPSKHRETLAYQSRNIADELGLSPVIVLGVLNDYREMLLHDLSKGFVCTILRVFTVRMFGGKLHFRGSSSLPEGVRVRLSPLSEF